MAGTVNKVILIGNLGQDPEIRSFGNGGQVANFSLATSENWKDKNTGERREKTEWHRVAVFGDGLVRVVQNYVKKGSKLYIEGKLETRKWQDKDGNDRYTTEVRVSGPGSTLTMLDGRGEGGGGGGDYGRKISGGDDFGGGGYGGGQGGSDFDLDDDIPF